MYYVIKQLMSGITEELMAELNALSADISSLSLNSKKLVSCIT